MMDTTTIEQLFEDNSPDPAVAKSQLARYGSFLLILLGSAVTLLGIALLEFVIIPANEIMPFLAAWTVPQFGSLAIGVHLTVSTPWRRYPMELRRQTILNAFSVAWLAFIAFTVRFLAAGAPACLAPGFLVAAVWGVALYYWRYTRHPQPKSEEMFP
jgi:hypothetical protein